MRRKVEVQDTVLSAVARTIGRTAGTLASMTQLLATEAAGTTFRSGSKEESGQRASEKKRTNGSVKKRKVKARKGAAKKRTASRRKTSASERGVRKKG